MNASARARSQERLVEGEFEFGPDDFRKIAATLREHSGIHLPDSKATLVYSRLAKRLRKLRLGSFREYMRFVNSPEGADERNAMLAALTTNVTSFFREPHHFEHFTKKVLEPKLDAIRAGMPFRIWSSACSTGPEPYSIAFSILSLMPDAPKYDVRILASDIDPVVLKTASEGVYAKEIVKNVPSGMRERWMQRESGRGDDAKYSVGPEARSIIRFRHLNLIGDWPMRKKFDAIFCRNVVIYFEEQTQNKIWQRFADHLGPDGRLYIGHSERVDRADLVNDGLTVYRLERGGRS